MTAYCSDAERTAQAVRQFGRACMLAFDLGDADADDPECLNFCLDELARRFAEQIACARAKRIAHAALTESNVCLDGRWIDFGRISTLSDYGPIMLGRNMPDFLQEHASLVAILRNLMFYLRKYLPPLLLASLMTERQVTDLFQQYLQERLRIEFLKLTGIPESSLADISPALIERTFACFNDILAVGNRVPFKLVPPDAGPFTLVMPERMGRFHLNSLLSRAATCSTAQQADAKLAEDIDDDGLRTTLIDCLWQLRAAFSGRFAEDARPLALEYMRLNALRRNARMDDMFHTVLNPRIAALVRDEGDLQQFMRPLLHRASLVLGEFSESELATARAELMQAIIALRAIVEQIAPDATEHHQREAAC